jgi:hypothetical protein
MKNAYIMPVSRWENGCIAMIGMSEQNLVEGRQRCSGLVKGRQ